MNRPTFYIKSMGCKSNQFEGEIIKENLAEYGFSEVNDVKSADFYILNSCSVTHKSDNETLYLLRNIRNLYPKVKTVLTGCVAQLEKEKLQTFDYIDYIFGNDDKFVLGELLSENIPNRVTDIMTVETFNYKTLNDTSKTRYHLKIQDGCNNRCAYCIIPFARGKSRSAESEFIIEQINKASSKGFKEVVLTGIHIGQWGLDIGRSFVDLIREIESKTDIPRYRLGSLNPLEISEELLDILEASNRFCPHFHLSLQSACDKTLKSMNRFYTVDNYLAQIDDINKRFMNPFLGCDIITGFPNETESDFETTLNNLKSSGLSKIHVFPYSVRKGTEAEAMEGHLPDSVKQARAELVKEVSKQKFNEFAKRNVGAVQQVVIEKRPDKQSGNLKGISKNYLKVIIDEEVSDKSLYFNTLAPIKLERFEGEKFFGRFV